MGNMSSMLFRT